MRRFVLGCLGALLATSLAACGEDPPATGPGAAPSSDPQSVRPAPRTVSPSPTPDPPRRPTRTRPAEPRSPVLGADMSWPQCPPGMGIPQKRSHGAPLPLPAAEYVVLGLTNGPGFYPNPCLPDQVAYVRERGLLAAAYAVASFPESRHLAQYRDSGPFDGGTAHGALSNVGYQQARFNVTSMLRTGLETPIVWIDVEPVPDFAWSADRAANAAVVRGLARGYRSAGYDIGVYSTPYLWEGVVGDLRLGVPEWRAAGQTSRAEALSRCGDDWVIQGGRGVLAQWVELDRDQNVTCPGIADEMGRWFHDY